MLAQAPEGRTAPSCGLRDVQSLVPHDRVDHLVPLSRDGLQRLAVRHASGAAARVVLAPSAIGPGEAVAREDEQVLQALADLVDDEGSGNSAKRESSSHSLLATGLLASTSPSRVATHAQCDDFPTSSPMTVPGLLGGAMAVSSNRQADREPSLRHPHYLAVAPAPGSFLSVVRSGGRLRWQHPPGPSSGQGQTAIRRRPIGGPSGLARIVGNAPNARHRSLSAAYLEPQWGKPGR